MIIVLAGVGVLAMPVPNDVEEVSLVRRDPTDNWLYRRNPPSSGSSHHGDVSGSESGSDSSSISSDTRHVTIHPDNGGNPVKVQIEKKPMGGGDFGAVHNVVSHNLPNKNEKLVVKNPSIGGAAVTQEAEHLDRLGKLRAVGKDVNQQPFIVQKKVKGEHLENTKAFAKATAQGPAAVDALNRQANDLTNYKATHIATKYGLEHLDIHKKNVKLSEDEHGNLKSAHMVDWLSANELFPKGQNRPLTQEEHDRINHATSNVFH
jgi:hypothetical protein